MIYLIALIFFAGFAMIALGWQESQQEASEGVAVRLQRLRTKREELTPQALQARERDLIAAKEFEAQARLKARSTTALPTLSNLFSTNAVLARLEQDLQQARSNWRASELLAASVLLALVVLILVNLLISPVLAVPLAGACLFLPWLYVKLLRAKYYRRFDEQLSDTLLLMSNSLKAGFSFLQAIDMVAREAQPPISDEFSRINQEITIGVPVDNALENMARRINSMDVDLMTTAVIIQREVGGSLSEILETIAGVIGMRIQLRGEIRTLTTQGRATGAVLGFLPLALGVLLHVVTKAKAPLEPSFVEPLLNTVPGNWMLGGAIILQILGFIIIWRIVSIKV
ncbi:MAG TPA: type II secretion system F family protein [Abditibacteriaceae bacterium]|jgi:tight adherence protein B